MSPPAANVANQVVKQAWRALQPYQRTLLEGIGAGQWRVADRALGAVVSELLRSAGSRQLAGERLKALDDSLGVWVPELRVMLINASHPKFEGLDESSFAAAISDVAWHEWGHALSLDRADNDEIKRGPKLLELAPPGIAENVRSGCYVPSQVTHELVANLFATLTARRQAGGEGKPEWLEEQLWTLVKKTTE